MPRFITAIVLALSAIPCCLSIWPIPRSLDSGNQILKLSGSFDISINFTNPPQDLLDAVTRTKYSIQTDQLGRLTVGRGSSDSMAFGSAKTLRTLMLALEQSASTAQPIATEAVVALDARDEGYSLSVPLDGSAGVVSANTTLGLLRGLSTFEQLWYTYDGTIYTNYAPLTIVNDSPAYINTFHWHITDSQSWPIQVVQFPELAQAGAYSTNQSYTPSDIQDVVTYAGERGIDVLVEIDTPGHTAIIGASHPEYVACYLSDWITFASEPPAGQLRLADASVTNFTAAVLAAVAETLPSTMFSTGGDELNTACYAADGATQMMLNESGRTLFEALDIFTSATHGALHALGKTAVVWEGEQLLWTEQSGPENLDSIVWPRAASSAEIFWTGDTLPDGFDRVGNISEALPRLHDVRYRMVQRGIKAIRLQPEWCALRPQMCDE
ncbi:hypothetical protein HHX47_DHR4000559 [Lentinula edodes]|nr:hypothetical protein HHX47_DHR4000559 [Lentinula edodes]